MNLTEAENKKLHEFVTNDDESTGPYPYDIQPHSDNFLRVLFGKEEIWDSFSYWVVDKLEEESGYIQRAKEVRFKTIPFLFHPDHRIRFLRLFLEWLEKEVT